MGAAKLSDMLADETRTGIDKELLSRVSGSSYSLKHSVLSCVASGRYEMAKKEIEALAKNHQSLDALKMRSHRLIAHLRELIEAIELKRSFPNLRQLPLAKQEEMQDRIVSHFEDIKNTITRIERIEADVRTQDVRSTLWVIRALAISGFAIILWAVILEAYRTMGQPANVAIEDVSNLFFSLLGF